MSINLTMPQLGESVTEGTIGRWLKQPGEAIAEFEPLLEVTTDKVDTEIPSTVDGTLVEILVPEGETVRVGAVIARLAMQSDTALEGQPESASSHLPGPASEAASTTTPPPAPTAAAAPASITAGAVSPAVARLVREHHVNLAAIRGTGMGGRVTKKDVEGVLALRSNGQPNVAVADATPVAPLDEEATLDPHAVVDPEPGPGQAKLPQPIVEVPPARPSMVPEPAAAPPSDMSQDDELIPLTAMRRSIAQHMVHSRRTAPHVTTVMEADFSAVIQHRAAALADYQRQNVKLTYTPYIVQSVVAALLAVPLVNSSFSEQGIIQHHRINVGLAVAIPDGLLVPVIKDADDKSLLGLARATNDLAERARNRRLQPEETRDGTFTITNHGVSGSIVAMPIINQPQSAILGVGAIQKRVVVTSNHGHDAIAIRPMCYLSLTFDHRVLDGATADAFLAAVKRSLEAPQS
ncbi:MAG: dihydrolipoamide acetyltransferase family protein [Herpetosiphon sp.]